MTDQPRMLTWQQEMFVQHFVGQDMENATRAAVLAGYSPKTAQMQASRLLTNVMIRRRIDEEKEARINRLALSKDRILLEVMRLAFIDVTGLFNMSPDGTHELKGFDDMTPDQRAAIVGLETEKTVLPQGKDGPDLWKYSTKVKVADKLAALTLLMRHMNLLPTSAKSLVVNQDNRQLSMSMETFFAGLTPDEIRRLMVAMEKL